MQEYTHTAKCYIYFCNHFNHCTPSANSYFEIYFRFDMCPGGNVSNTIMCPDCMKYCPYWKLQDSCTLSKVAYLADNYGTIAFSILMAFWGNSAPSIIKTLLTLDFKNMLVNFCVSGDIHLIFLEISNWHLSCFSAVLFQEFWKRKQSVIAWEWDLNKFEEEEQLRPEYERKVKTTR